MTEYGSGERIEVDSSCPICTGRIRRLLSRQSRDGSALETVMCEGCGLIHSNPIPTREELAAFYNAAYRQSYKATARPKLKHVLRYAPGALARVQEIVAHCRPGQTALLDVGAGSGEFLYMARRCGFEIQGIEPHRGYAEYSRSDLGLPVEHATLEEVRIAPSSLDVINLNHVLEHLPAPLETLCQLNDWLRGDGLLAVAVPDISACRHSPATRFHYAHVHNFNARTLIALLIKAGFEPIAPNGSTSVIARKTGSRRPDLALAMHDNFSDLLGKLTAQTMRAHYRRATPYARFLRKCYQYPAEYLRVALRRDPVAILDACFERAQAAGGLRSVAATRAAA